MVNLDRLPHEMGTRNGCPLSLLQFNIWSNGRKKIKGIRIGKEGKRSLFADDRNVSLDL